MSARRCVLPSRPRNSSERSEPMILSCTGREGGREGGKGKGEGEGEGGKGRGRLDILVCYSPYK